MIVTCETPGCPYEAVPVKAAATFKPVCAECGKPIADVRPDE